MNKGILEISFNTIEELLVKEYPQLKDVDLHITCAEVDNFTGRIKVQFVTDKVIDNLSYKVILTGKDVEKIKEKSMLKYAILHSVFYKHMFKAIKNKDLKIIFYHDNYDKLKVFQNIIQEEDFKKLFNKEIKSIHISKDTINILFLNGSNIQFIYAIENKRACKYHYAIVDNNISKEKYDNIVLPGLTDYFKDGEPKELEGQKIEFMDFDC